MRRQRGGAYELADSGQRLGRVWLSALARVGLGQLGAPAADEDVDAEALVLWLRASFHRDKRGGRRRCEL
jgi:hypothetical protein